MSEFVLLLVILVEGFVTISAEVLTMRQLLPVVGNSVIVSSLIIGVFLLFLAYGYRKGGFYQKNYIPILKSNFTKSAIWLGVGLSYKGIELFFNLFHHYISTNILIALSCYLIVATAPLVYILGQTVPITMNLIKDVKVIGAVGGKILHLSTIGSFLGAVLTSLVLMNYLGVAWSIVINYCFLMFLAFLLFKNKKQDFIKGFILCVMLIFVYNLNVTMEERLFIKTNNYADYRVINSQDKKILMLNSSPSSMLTSQKEGFNYIEFIKKVLFQDLKLKDKDILVLGAGGFTLSAAGDHRNHFLYVDIDKDLKNVVEENFLNPIHGKFVAADARQFLNSNQKKFTVIVSDVYSNQRAIPAHLLTQEYFAQIKRNLHDKGIAILNIIARPTLEDSYSKTIDTTIRSVFTDCMVVPLRYTSVMNNIIYICHHKDMETKKELQLYRDDLNRAPQDFFETIKN